MLTPKSSFITCSPLFEVTHNHCTYGFKLEQYNTLGSIKSRAAFYLIQDILNSDYTNDSIRICESTSGNLGLALNQLAQNEGIDFLCLIDNSISKKKLKKLIDNGVHYELVSADDPSDYREARIERAHNLSNEGYIWTNQYDNPASVRAHYETTGPEIFHQTNGKLTHLVCAMGTGGTIIGTGKYLKEKNPNITIVGVEPWGSTIFSSFEGDYLCAGAGMKGAPGNIKRNPNIINEHYTVKDSDSINCCNYLKEKYGISVGITSGMAFYVARIISEFNPNSYIVVICPDGRDSYEEYF